MKNIVIIFFVVLALAMLATPSLAVALHKKTTVPFTIEWHEITPRTYPVLSPTLEALGPVFSRAFVPVLAPYVRLYEPPEGMDLANVALDDEQALFERIAAFVQNDWTQMVKENAHRPDSGYLAIAKNSRQETLGFAIFDKKTFGEHMHSAVAIDGSVQNQHALDALTSDDQDAIYGAILAVDPAAQGIGVGRALVFSVFTHCPSIKKIFLTTSADQLNQGTQAFYERLGFTYVLRVMLNQSSWGNFWREKRVYLYQKE